MLSIKLGPVHGPPSGLFGSVVMDRQMKRLTIVHFIDVSVAVLSMLLLILIASVMIYFILFPPQAPGGTPPGL